LRSGAQRGYRRHRSPRGAAARLGLRPVQGRGSGLGVAAMRGVAVLLVLALLVLSTGCAGIRGAGGRPAKEAERPAAPVATPGQLDGRALFGDVPARAARLGASEPTLVASGEAVENG